MTRALAFALWVAGCSGPSVSPRDAPTDDIAIDTPSIDMLDAARSEVTLFVVDYGRAVIERYRVTPATASPTPELTIAVTGALSPVYVPASGELVATHFSSPALIRVSQPLASPTTIGQVTGFGFTATMQKMVVIGDEVWVVSPNSGNVLRVKFDANGVATAGGAAIAATSGRGIAYDPVHRQVFVTECCVTNSIRRYALRPNGTTSPLPTMTGNGLDNPHAMVVTPWHELLVANANTSTILRYALDAAGSPTPNGTISGNGLSGPIDMVLTPWNELYVTNQATGTLSRFTFDPTTHDAIARDSFAVPSAVNVAWLTMY